MNSVAVSYLANNFLNGTAFEVCERNSRTYDGNSDVLTRSFCYIIMDQKANFDELKFQLPPCTAIDNNIHLPRKILMNSLDKAQMPEFII